MNKEESIKKSREKYELRRQKTKELSDKLEEGRIFAKNNNVHIGSMSLLGWDIDFGWIPLQYFENRNIIKVALSYCSPKDAENSYSRKKAIGYIGDRLKNDHRYTFTIKVPKSLLAKPQQDRDTRIEKNKLFEEVVKAKIITILYEKTDQCPGSLSRKWVQHQLEIIREPDWDY